MAFRNTILASAAVFALSTGFATAESHVDVTADTVVATVNGAEITLGQLIMLRSQLPEQYLDFPDDVIFNGLIDQLINQQVLGDTLEVEPKRIEIGMANHLRSLRAGEVVVAFTDQPVDETDLQALFEEQFGSIEPELEFNASHILVETQEEALEIQTMIADGADFAQTAMEKSTGPSGPNGGNLGWFGPGMMVAPFEEAVVALEVGAVSDPVETQFGWHVVKLNETRSTNVPTLEDVREALTQELMESKLDAYIDTLVADAEVFRTEAGEFDYSQIRNIDLLKD